MLNQKTRARADSISTFFKLAIFIHLESVCLPYRSFLHLGDVDAKAVLGPSSNGDTQFPATVHH